MQRIVNFGHHRLDRSVSLAVMLALMAGSVPAFAQPRQASNNDTLSCRLLSRVNGNSGYGKNINWRETAKQAALKRAEKLGATDVVWEQFTPVGAFNGTAEAKAFVCSHSLAQLAQKSGN